MSDLPSATLRSGAAMPLLGFGTWQLSGERAYAAVRRALDVGYRHLDTATMYRNEHEVGRALRQHGIERDAVFVTTKLPPERAGQARRTLHESLDALGLDRLDLWLVHWPPGGRAAPDTWQELVSARDEGLVTAIGVSNYTTAQIDELTTTSGETPEVNQIKWSPALYDARRESELRDRGVVLEGYSPFRASDLGDPTLRDVAAAHGATVPQVIVRWHLQHGFVVIPKSAHPERIAANADVAGFHLDDDEMARIDALGR